MDGCLVSWVRRLRRADGRTARGWEDGARTGGRRADGRTAHGREDGARMGGRRADRRAVRGKGGKERLVTVDRFPWHGGIKQCHEEGSVCTAVLRSFDIGD